MVVKWRCCSCYWRDRRGFGRVFIVELGRGWKTENNKFLIEIRKYLS